MLHLHIITCADEKKKIGSNYRKILTTQKRQVVNVNHTKM